MTHDVFICHSSEDKTTADAVLATLEARGIQCWISPRDVVPGTDYASSIVDAIASSALVVLVFSSNSNASSHVGREIERAVSHGIPILPFRVEAIEPSPALEYYISVAHWLDAFTPPLEQHLEHLAGTIQMLLDRAPTASITTTPLAGPAPPMGPAPEVLPGPVPPTSTAPRRARTLLGAAVVVVVLAGGAIVALNRGDGGCVPGPSADLADCDLRDRDLSGADLTGADLSAAELTGADLSDADLRRAVLDGANLSDVDLRGADVRQAALHDADLSGADLSTADLTGAHLRGADLTGVTADGTTFEGADLGRARLAGVDLSSADVRGADLTDAELDGATLSGIDLSGATGISLEQLAAALGVPTGQVAARMTVEGIRLDAFDAIVAAVAPARDGIAVAGTSPYTDTDGFHPIVLLGPGPDTSTPAWAIDVQDAWAPMGIRFAELVAVAGEETWEVIEVCEYSSGGVSAPSITRYQALTSVRILAASDGELVAEQSFLGTAPRTCEPNEPYWLEELRGEPPDLATEAVPFIESIVHPPAG